HRSPYLGDARRRSMTFAYAAGDVSARNVSTSAGVGGRPVRSNVARLMRVRRSACFAGISPFSSSPARMKLSIPFVGHHLFLTSGIGLDCTGRKDQNRFCDSVSLNPVVRTALLSGQSAPDFTQAVRSAISEARSLPGGGILIIPE